MFDHESMVERVFMPSTTERTMTRAAEFCYIAERADGAFLSTVNVTTGDLGFTRDPEMAIRSTVDGCQKFSGFIVAGKRVGFRKVLAG